MGRFKTIDEFLHNLDESKKQQVIKLREYIHDSSLELTEHIKWNALSYVQGGEDRITFNLNNKEQIVKLVFHMGATRKENRSIAPILENSHLIKWVSDIRGYMSFQNLEEITSQKELIKQDIKNWLLVD